MKLSLYIYIYSNKESFEFQPVFTGGANASDGESLILKCMQRNNPPSRANYRKQEIENHYEYNYKEAKGNRRSSARHLRIKKPEL